VALAIHPPLMEDDENRPPLVFIFTQEQEVIYQPLKLLSKEKDYRLSARARGGGFSSQVKAIRLATARALLEVSPEYKTILRNHNDANVSLIVVLLVAQNFEHRLLEIDGLN
ncbi:22962_t:CDS:2, partial [Racocetra persica]